MPPTKSEPMQALTQDEDKQTSCPPTSSHRKNDRSTWRTWAKEAPTVVPSEQEMMHCTLIQSPMTPRI